MGFLEMEGAAAVSVFLADVAPFKFGLRIEDHEEVPGISKC